MDPVMLLTGVVALGMGYQWVHHRATERMAETRRRQERCPHLPEVQRTSRTPSQLTLNPALINAVLPGLRHLTKVCGDCGLQTPLYGHNLQPWDTFKAEFDQETIDRAVQYAARERNHKAEAAAAEIARLKRRQGNLPGV